MIPSQKAGAMADPNQHSNVTEPAASAGHAAGDGRFGRSALTTTSPDFVTAVEAIRPLLDEFGRRLGDVSPTMPGVQKATPCEDPSSPDGPWQVTVQDYWATEPNARLLAEVPTTAAEVFAGWQSDTGSGAGVRAGTGAGPQRFWRADRLLAATVTAGSTTERGWVTVSISTICAVGPNPAGPATKPPNAAS
jgi:hypothetical protein